MYSAVPQGIDVECVVFSLAAVLHMAVSTLCVCDHDKYRNAKRYNLGVTCFSPPLPVPKVIPKISPFNKNKINFRMSLQERSRKPKYL